MSSTEFNIGLGDSRSSSRVLRPPGGASSNIFAPAEEARPHVRPKYDQQNSSNLNFCMNTVDPNLKVQQQFAEAEPEAPAAAPVAEAQHQNESHLSEDGVDHKFNGNVQAEPAQPAAALPQYHHHRSTALW